MKKLLTAGAAIAIALTVPAHALLAHGLQAEDVPADEIQQRIAEGAAPLILDVRRPDEFAAGHLPGAMNISHDELGDRLSELGIELDAEIVVYCRSGRRAGVAEAVLGEAGYTNIRDLEGHWLEWQAAGRPTESEE